MKVISVEKRNDFEFLGQVSQSQALLFFVSRQRLVKELPISFTVTDCVFNVEAVVCTPEDDVCSKRCVQRPDPCDGFDDA